MSIEAAPQVTETTSPTITSLDDSQSGSTLENDASVEKSLQKEGMTMEDEERAFLKDFKIPEWLQNVKMPDWAKGFKMSEKMKDPNTPKFMKKIYTWFKVNYWIMVNRRSKLR
ncbi:unnamed protein product [Peronospora belbahrii]|uniref:Uncharacterized protein n=1 Tax=Peronospora belbahrii TaxID=622444 RepID=A0AAU9L112_9STRA|nr:unnamed protein product [Peronospora belbahrii]